MGKTLGERCANLIDDAILVWVPAATFPMSSADAEFTASLRELPYLGKQDFTTEQPRHQVTLDGFWIARTEVSVAQYRAF